MSFWKKRADGSMEPADPNALSDVEFKPKEFEEKITSSFKTQLEAFQAANVETNKPLVEMAQAIAAERAERKAKADREAAAKTREENQVTDEDFLLDPQGATRKQLQPVAQATMMLAAKMARQETLGEKEYYHGEIKSKVDALIATLPLAQQTNEASLMNCYKIACYDHQKDITEGKIKAKNTSAIFEGGSTGAHSGKENEGSNETLTAEEKHVAQVMGVSEKDWISSRRELSYV